MTEGLLGKSSILAQIPKQELSGAGLSDWEGYAAILREKFSYQNTFYHQAPRLDICNPEDNWNNSVDFLISTDVFEHVLPPSQLAFDGSFKILRPGGIIVLTAPYGDNPETIEHYPDLVDFAIVKIGDQYVVVVKSDSGSFYLDENPVFHGGPGTTLEMRIFSYTDIVAKLQAAGFVDIKRHDAPVAQWGIFPPHHHGLPITARKPK